MLTVNGPGTLSEGSYVLGSATHFGSYGKSVSLRLAFNQTANGQQEIASVQFRAITAGMINGEAHHLILRHEFSSRGHHLEIQVLNGVKSRERKETETLDEADQIKADLLEGNFFKIIDPSHLVAMIDLQGKFSKTLNPKSMARLARNLTKSKSVQGRFKTGSLHESVTAFMQASIDLGSDLRVLKIVKDAGTEKTIDITEGDVTIDLRDDVTMQTLGDSKDSANTDTIAILEPRVVGN